MVTERWTPIKMPATAFTILRTFAVLVLDNRLPEWICSISENESHPYEFSMTENKFRTWIEKIGVIGFLFFFAKGLVWLIAAGVATLFLR